jgi:hypothetical protein
MFYDKLYRDVSWLKDDFFYILGFVIEEDSLCRQYEQLAQQKEKSRLISQEGVSQEHLR